MSSATTTSWADLIVKIAKRCGLGASPTTERAAQLGEFALDRLAVAWGWAWWPNATIVTSVPYRGAWSNAATYALGAEVWDGGTNYYRSLQAANHNNALTDAAWWVLITNLDPIIPWDGLGTVEGVYFCEAEARRRMNRIHYEVRAGFLYLFAANGPKVPWIRYRKPLPDVTAESTPDDVPAELVPYIVEGAQADYARFEGKTDSADRLEGLAVDKLVLAAITQLDQQGEAFKTEVANAGLQRPGKYYGPTL